MPLRMAEKFAEVLCHGNSLEIRPLDSRGNLPQRGSVFMKFTGNLSTGIAAKCCKSYMLFKSMRTGAHWNQEEKHFLFQYPLRQT